ncbi:MAG: COP23 domain-containing protein [Cyanosarcina radialis HA8281-LM2]|nr:COP23 domain-containing protein [Cyanosarcina radialis HA8281-LM2]
MLRKSLVALSGVVALSSVGTILSAPSYAESVNFRCDTSGSLPTLVARSEETGRTTPIIRFFSEYFADSGYNSYERCYQVAGRFQDAFNEGRLDFLTVGIVNRQKVVCATYSGGSCNSSNVLFTLKSGADAADTLQRLFNVRDLAAGPLFESTGRPYIEFSTLLQR